MVNSLKLLYIWDHIKVLSAWDLNVMREASKLTLAHRFSTKPLHESFDSFSVEINDKYQLLLSAMWTYSRNYVSGFQLLEEKKGENVPPLL